MSEPVGSADIAQENKEQENKISSLVSKAVTEYQATSTVSEETAKEIGQYDPKVVAQSLFNSPPEITIGTEVMKPHIEVYPPKPIDIEYSLRDTSQIGSPDAKMADVPKQYAELLKEYLSLPYVADGFDTHKAQRWPWQHALNKTLVEVSKKASGNPEDRGTYSVPFADLWDSNKATTNKISNIKSTIDIMGWLSEDPAYQDEVYTLYMAIEAEAVNQDKPRTREDTDRIAGIARDTLDLITKNFTKEAPNETALQ